MKSITIEEFHPTLEHLKAEGVDLLQFDGKVCHLVDVDADVSCHCGTISPAPYMEAGKLVKTVDYGHTQVDVHLPKLMKSSTSLYWEVRKILRKNGFGSDGATQKAHEIVGDTYSVETEWGNSPTRTKRFVPMAQVRMARSTASFCKPA